MITLVYFFSDYFPLLNQLPLEQSIENPDILVTDWAKMDNPLQLHLGMQALDFFKEQNGRYIKRTI